MKKELTVKKARKLLQAMEKKGKGKYRLCIEVSDPELKMTVPQVLRNITHHNYDGDLVVVY